MSFSYQFGANPPIDWPRMLVADTVDANHIWEDSEIMAAYQIDSFAIWPPVGGGVSQVIGTPSARRTAATLLDCLASDKARLASAMKVLDIQVDTTKAATELRAQAKALRDTEAMSGNFAIAEQCNDQFSSRERVWKQWMRLYAGN